MSGVDAGMANLKIGGDAPSLVAKRPPGSAGKPIDVVSNFWELSVQPNMAYFKYDFRVYASFVKSNGEGEAVREFSKQTRDDFTEQQRKQACVEVFGALCKMEKMFEGTIYDRAAILFSTTKLAGVGKDEKRFELPPDCQTVSKDAAHVYVLVKQAADSFQVTSADIRNVVNSDFKKGEGKGIMEVLNLATSQTVFFSPNFITYGNGNIYLMDPSMCGFTQRDAPEINKNMYVGVGMSKGVKVLEGPNSAPGKPDYKACLVADVKKTAFHFDRQPLHEKMMLWGERQCNPRVLTRDLRDLKCETTYGKKACHVTIGAFTQDSIKDCTFADETGKKHSIVNYFEQKYNVRIKHLELPGVVDKYTRNVYPAETLVVAPNQRVKAHQNTKSVVEALIKVSAVVPPVRQRQEEKITQSLELGNAVSVRTGISLPANSRPLPVPGRVLPPVQLQGNGPTMNGPSWRGNRFLHPAALSNWGIVLMVTNRRDTNFFENYVRMLTTAAQQKGMTVRPAALRKIVVTTHQTAEKTIDEIFKEAASMKLEFVMIISEEDFHDHAAVKQAERRYGIISQQIKYSKAEDTVRTNKTQTLENVLMKTNSKLGGITHIIMPQQAGLLAHPDALIMGLTIQQPRALTAKEIETGGTPHMPAIIGIGANNGALYGAKSDVRDKAAQQYFSAFYTFAYPRDWPNGEKQNDTLKMCIMDTLRQFKNNRGLPPKKVIVIRGGISEGQLPMVASTERDIFLDAFKSISPTYNPAFAIVAASKEHNGRFYHKNTPVQDPNDRRRVDQNLPAGTVVDRVVVNPEYNEFYLQSHKALQGTAKATKYSLVHEGAGGTLTMDQIEYTMNALCHLHQIVNSTTAIPSCLYVAEEAIKRGTEQLQHVASEAGCNVEDMNKLVAIGRDHVLNGKRYNA